MPRVVHATVAGLLLMSATTSWAQQPQQPPAGVVTTLEGNVTATRAAAPQPFPLKFKDNVFQQDRIATAEQSLARMLLGGKAVVTVRERSVLTITEIPGRTQIDIESGKFALAVARERMRAGELIEIRTPNAVAGVRGSVVITDVQGPPTQPAQVTTDFYVLTGAMDAQPATPGTRAPIGTPQTMAAMQQFRVIGLGPGTLSAIRPDQLGAIRAGLQPKSKSHTDAANAADLRAGAVSTAVGLANVLGNQPIVASLQATPPSATSSQTTTNTVAPLTPFSTDERGLEGVIQSANLSSGGGALVGGQLTNPGFETGDFTGWNLVGAGGVVSQFGALRAPEGQFMGLIHTRTNSILSGCGPGNDCTRSTLTQGFSVSSIVSVSAKGFLLSNEFPSFTSTQSEFNDRYLIQLIDSTGAAFTLFDQRVNQVAFTSSAGGSGAGFTLSAGGGEAIFDLGKKTVVVAPGNASLLASVSNVSDSAFDSAFILDAVLVTQDPPLHFFSSGVGQSSGALLSVANDSRTFDSLLMVCCGAAYTLTGPALDATNSVLDVPFSVVSAIQGGRIVSTWSGPMIQLNGGSYTLGPIVGIFDVAGLDPSDRPLEHSGVFLDATSAAINSGSALRVDTALLNATAPILNLKSSTMVANDSVIDLSFRARVSSLGPMIALNNSTLTLASGALVNVGGGSVLGVNGHLVQLANGSTLSLLGAPLARVTGNSTLAVSGALVSFVGAGNALNLNNSICASLACTNLGGLNVALTGGASAANVSLTNPIQGTGAVNIAPNAAAIVVSGPGSTVKVGP